jgi:hypothetical protein
MLRRLLNIASIVCLVLCVALIGMWVLSYWWSDACFFNPFGASPLMSGSAVGRIVIGIVRPKFTGSESGLLNFTHRPIADWRTELPRIDRRWSTVAGFGTVKDVNEFAIMIPDWFAALMVGVLSFAPWSRVKYRFGLRSLFIVTTFLAVVLGMIAWLDRAWIGK